MWCKVTRTSSVNDRAMYFLALLLAFPCLGLGLLERESQIETLIGIQGVQVEINIGLSQDGPIKQELQEQIENQLREAEFRVLGPVGEDHSSFQPSLLIEVSILKSDNKPYVYFIYANLFQPVQLMGHETSETLGATWQAGLIGEGGLDRIREDVAMVVKHFLSQHKKANMGKYQSASK